MDLPLQSNSQEIERLLPPAEQRALARQQQMSMMAMQQLQLTRTIWMMASVAGGQMEIDESLVNPLWEVKYERSKDSPTKLTVIAGSMPEPTDEQIQSLSQRIHLTAKDPRDEAINVGLVDYPLAYLRGRLAPYCVWHEKHWISREVFDQITAEQKG